MIGDEPVVTSTTHEGMTVVRPRGDLDQDSAPLLAGILAEAAASGAPRTVVDLSRTRFADSSVLHALLDAHKAHRAAGTALVLAGPLQVAVRRLFDITGTGPAFHMADSLEDAMTC
ncbi:STAS domain-containing protein [Streptomyces antarcticus]|uniref:STAS domain-containing protein n=1 Tax=Streptomyces antarcticus TaxID=2996458 RepID=UPI00226DD069|nr:MULTISPECIES: STAS domain-containing protein [unclassified Streptomyces]MCY0940355.1 STAS domain-containing protein [Streptomyces sp. H34-AA3]MCZ4088260.1 STAS domain-containing protein [Streptomyces sp. H34-S5]